jgi:hypothetical protein
MKPEHCQKRNDTIVEKNRLSVVSNQLSAKSGKIGRPMAAKSGVHGTPYKVLV